MKTNFSWLAVMALSLTALGCAAPAGPAGAQLTYETKPEGATLFEAGVALGTAPLTRSYRGDGKPTITTPAVTAVWPSGAKAVFWTQLRPGADEVATLERPANAPDLQKDLDHAAKFVTAKEQEARRLKEEARREQARASARCKQQQQSGQGAPISDC